MKVITIGGNMYQMEKFEAWKYLYGVGLNLLLNTFSRISTHLRKKTFSTVVGQPFLRRILCGALSSLLLFCLFSPLSVFLRYVTVLACFPKNAYFLGFFILLLTLPIVLIGLILLVRFIFSFILVIILTWLIGLIVLGFLLNDPSWLNFSCRFCLFG